MYEGPEFSELRAFLAVVEHASITRAATSLHITQPSLSAKIKRLEEDLKIPLFRRLNGGVVLTRHGHELVPLARQIKAMQENLLSRLRSGASTPAFRLGVSHWLSSAVVHEAIVGYRDLVPGGTLQPMSNVTQRLCEQLEGEQIDAALVSMPIRNRTFHVQPVCNEKLFLCMRADDPLATHPTIPADQVSDKLRIQFHRDLHPGLNDEIEQTLAKAGIALRATEFSTHPNELQLFVKEGLGWGLSRHRSQLDPELTLRPIEGVKLVIRTAFVTLRAHETAVIPLLAYRIRNACSRNGDGTSKRPAQSSRDSGQQLPLHVAA